MATLTHTYTERLTTLNCARCGIVFGIPTDYEERRRSDHNSFYCPSGHTNVYNGKSEAEKLREQLAARDRAIEAERARVDYWRREQEQTKLRLSATKGQLTKTKKRVAGGACPCCSRTFVDVARHMKTKHPDYAEVTS